jgi:hypothetical protein
MARTDQLLDIRPGPKCLFRTGLGNDNQLARRITPASTRACVCIASVVCGGIVARSITARGAPCG